MPQITSVALSLHEASTVLREYAAKKLQINPADILLVQVVSYNRSRLEIKYDQLDNYAWTQLDAPFTHRTYGGQV